MSRHPQGQGEPSYEEEGTRPSCARDRVPPSVRSSAASAKQTRRFDHRAPGSSLVARSSSSGSAPSGRPSATRSTYAGVGSGAGIAQITARTVDFGASDAPLNPSAGHGLQRLYRDPVGALGDHARRTTSRTSPSELRLDAADDRRHLPRVDHELERSGDREAEPEGDPAEPVDHGRSTGRTARVTRTPSPTTSSASASTFQSQVGIEHARELAGRHRASGNAGVAGVIANTPGAIGYVSAAYTLPNHLKFAAIKNAAGGFATPGLRGHRGSGGRRSRSRPRPRTASRCTSSTRRSRRREAGLPDLDVHLRDRPAPDRRRPSSSAR